MRYLLEPIGARFSDRDLGNLAQQFNAHTSEGYQLHSVFQVSQPSGCLGNQSTATYVAIYVKQDDPSR